uniref:Uncharacterized protein n=1 Tax=Mycena chlorophos TaxID=658473 RepID=A0ABQ0M348_MYCCL|nr:predicted protein [Mycena chlorophos]
MLKRKISELDGVDADGSLAKQTKLFPFPNTADDDACMTDIQYPEPQQHRFPSSVSDASSVSPATSPAVYHNALPTDAHNLSAQSSSVVGLLQPSNTFAHHGTSCDQIPKLRVACAAPGPGGIRSLWSFCEVCGAISMVESATS